MVRNIRFSLSKQLIIAIANYTKPSTLIEVCTFPQNDYAWASNYFNKIFVIKSSSDEKSIKDSANNITFIEGKSCSELNDLASKIGSNNIFLLDSIPFREEDKTDADLLEDLKVISKTQQPSILINNVAYLGGTLPYADKYKKLPSLENVFEACKSLFPNYYTTIIDGCLICVPKELESIINSYWVKTFNDRFFERELISPQKRSIWKRAISRGRRIIGKREKKKEAVAYNIRNNAWFDNECEKFKDAHKWLIDKNFKNIVDIGANVGQFGKKIRQYYPNAKLYSFEPIPFVCDELNLNFEGDPNFKSFNVGLGNNDGTTTFHLNLFSDSSSMLKMADLHKENFPYTKDEVEIEVVVRKLDNCFKPEELEKPYLVKIDVQGFEDQVIDGGIDVIKNAEMIITESSYKELYEGQALFDTIYEKLKALGFEFIGNLEQMESAFNGEPLQGDAIFQKKK